MTVMCPPLHVALPVPPAAPLHAPWNTVIKSSEDRLLSMAVVIAVGGMSGMSGMGGMGGMGGTGGMGALGARCRWATANARDLRVDHAFASMAQTYPDT